MEDGGEATNREEQSSVPEDAERRKQRSKWNRDGKTPGGADEEPGGEASEEHEG